MRRSLQALLCAAMLIGGALAAHHTDVGRPSPAQAAVPAEAPVASAGDDRFRTRPGALGRRSAAEHEPLVHDSFGYRHRGGMNIVGHTPHRLILFTFDDGPDRIRTPKVLDHLDATGVRAIFFLTASRMHGVQADIAREIVRRGHTVASHTLDHLQLPAEETPEVIRQIDEAEQVFRDVLGARPWLIRVPGGGRSPRIDGLVADRGYTSVLWNLGTGDFQVRTPEEVLTTWSRVLERLEREGSRGGIVLMHDTHDWSVDAFPLIFAEIQRRNCELLERDEELFDIVDDLRFFHVERGTAAATADAPPALVPDDVLQRRQARLRRAARQRCR